MEPAVTARLAAGVSETPAVLLPCPDCGTAPDVRHGDYAVEVACPQCNDAEIVDNQWVRHGRWETVRVAYGVTWDAAEVMACAAWNESVADWTEAEAKRAADKAADELERLAAEHRRRMSVVGMGGGQ